ncbi:unnamed protein product [Protopolystoma xenopodis]|uniref:Uncharacterized protein n=1 Tax=Protopolystoma xenopodis TaxID=117903 RepID=A0A448XPN4_9PLAT|nr:unnamed protein product [Protopolystoma xenopodis]
MLDEDDPDFDLNDREGQDIGFEYSSLTGQTRLLESLVDARGLVDVNMEHYFSGTRIFDFEKQVAGFRGKHFQTLTTRSA